MEMNLYQVLSTGDEEGLIQVVKDAETTASIQAGQAGSHFGASKAAKAFEIDALEKWLRQHNTTEEEWDKCVERFQHSCAAYCVASYVLGIADRHNDNIMLRKNGQALSLVLLSSTVAINRLLLEIDLSSCFDDRAVVSPICLPPLPYMIVTSLSLFVSSSSSI